jgi:hypothetical protein
MQVVEEELALHARVRAAAEAVGAPLPDPPYGAHLALETDGRRWDLLLGESPLVDSARGVMLATWHGSRLADVFFEAEEGEAYELRSPGPRGGGRLLAKRLLRFDGGALVAIDAPGGGWARAADGRWRAVARPSPPRLLPDGVAPLETGTAIARVGGRLDARQRTVLEMPPAQPLLVVGSAGSGKTTAALHRLAQLHRQDGRRFVQSRLLVVLPEPGLAELTTAVLRDLGLGEVRVATFDDWIARQARRVFADLPLRECSAPPAAVIRLKRHPALRAALPRFVAARAAELARRLDGKLAGRGAIVARWAALAGDAAPPRAALDRLERALLDEAPPSLHGEISGAVALERARLYEARPDLLALFGDRALLGDVAAASAGELASGAVAEVVEHTRQQFAATSDERFADIEASFKRTADGRHLDEGTPDEDARTVDREDYAVCFELLRLKTGAQASARGRLPRYAAVVIDEAQDFAAIELALLGRALAPGAAVTVCGDRWQQIDPHARFRGWAALVSELGPGFATVALQQSHRCSEPVTRHAHALLGPLAPSSPPEAAAPGLPVLESRCPSELHALQLIRDALVDLGEHAPRARVAVIARGAERARRVHAALPRRLHARLALAGDLTRSAGIQVTTVAHVKGLEFDAVIVPDADAYGDDDGARRQLYVVCTRALARLWVVRVGGAAAT